MISQEEIDEACTNHNLWVEESKGERADFNNCVFKGLSLKEMQFNGAVFKDCEFIDTDLSEPVHIDLASAKKGMDMRDDAHSFRINGFYLNILRKAAGALKP